MTWMQRAGRTRTASRVRAGGLVVGCAAAVLVACGSGGVGGEESSSAASADGGTHADRTGFGSEDGGALGALVLEPANATLDVGAPGASLPFKATIGGRDVTSGLAWSIESASLGTVDASGTFRASAKHGGVTVVHVASGTRRASANLTVNLKLVDEGTVDKATIAKLAGTATGPAHGWLYPYEGTVFPRGLLPPKLQFDSATGEAVKLRVRAKSLDYTGYFKGSNPGRIDLSPALWTMITLSAGSNDPVTFDVASVQGSVVRAAPARVIRVAQGSLKGVVYYNSYDSKLARAGAEKDYGAIMRIRPGATAEVYQGGQAGGCTVCHNVSANGNVILTTRENPSPGEGRSNYVSRVTNTSTNASVRNQDDGSFVWGGLSPNGDLTLSNGVPPIASRKDEWGPIVVGSGRIGLDDRPSRLYDTKTGTVIPTPSWDAKVRYAYMPSFSPDGKRVTYNDYSNVGAPTAGKILGVADFDPASKTFANVTQLTTDPQFVGWPIVTPDSKSVVYGSVSRDDYGTWGDARGDLKIVHVASKTVASLDRLNGVENGKVTLPAGENEAHRNFEPTILPQPVGGYFWVVFTSRRKIGNVVATDDAANPARKKLWVAALDIPPAELPSTKATDTSHPAFYLEGQELEAGNMRGFWSLDQCKNTGTTCEPGVDDCCDGYCRQDASASGTAFTCVAKKDGCSKEAERCDTAADCCDVDAQATCTNGKCVKATPR